MAIQHATKSVIASSSLFAIDGRRQEFLHPDTEDQFSQDEFPVQRARMRFSLMLCGFFYLAFGITDISVLGFGADAMHVFLARLLVAGTAGACCLLSYRRGFDVAALRLCASVTELVGMAAFTVVLHYRAAELPWHSMSMALMVIVVYLYIPNRLSYAAGIALLSTLSFIGLAVAQNSLRSSDLLTMSMLLLLANAFGFDAARRYQRSRREEFSARAALQGETLRDPLTGSYNRRYLQQELLDKEISRALRYRQHLGVIMCDIDHFKHVNDTLGHDVGDQVLIQFAAMLKRMTRANVDSVIRYGGEEFLIVLPETDQQSAAQLAERLRLQCPSMTLPGNEQLTASFGVATCDFSASMAATLPQLITLADQELYKAKKNGRNRVSAAIASGGGPD